MSCVNTGSLQRERTPPRSACAWNKATTHKRCEFCVSMPSSSRAADRCEPITQVLDAHAAGPQQSSRESVVVLVSPAGLGDQISGFLACAVAAIASGRRLEIAPQRRSYLDVGFTLPFNSTYTGAPEWLSEAQTWFDHRLRRPDFWRPLPRLEREQFGVSYVAKMSWIEMRNQLLLRWDAQTSYAKKYPPLLRKPTEMVLGGNSGTRAFTTFFGPRLRRLNQSSSPEHIGCALRHWLRPSVAATAMRERLRPWVPSVAHAAGSPMAARVAGRKVVSRARLQVGIHVRAEASLAARAERSEVARYTSNRTDALLVGRCGARGSDEGDIGAKYDLDLDFSEYWIVAKRAAEWLDDTDPIARPASDRQVPPGVLWVRRN